MVRSTSFFGAFPFNIHFEICLQNGPVFCICRSASNLSADKDLGVVFSVSATSGAVKSVYGVEVDKLCWAVLLLVSNAGPSECVADSMLIAVGLFGGNSTRHERQSAALLPAPDIHSKVMLHGASSSPHLLTFLFAFLPFKNLASVFVVISDQYFSSLEVVSPLYDCILYIIGFLLCGAPFWLSIN